MTNDDALHHWSGDAGEHWAAAADRYDRMNRHVAHRIVQAAAPQPGERFLDVGCGNGALALDIASRVAPTGRATGLDLSQQMLEVARRRATDQRLGNVEFLHGDAQTDDLGPADLDAIVSRFGVMFFADPQAAFTNLARALRPGGRLVFACWQDMAHNEWVTAPAAAALEHVPLPAGLADAAAHGAFSLSDPQATTALLEASGFVDVTVTEVVESMWMGSSVEDAVGFMRTTEFATILFTDVEPGLAAAGWDAVADALATHVTVDGVELQGATWLVSAANR
jgi:SAM-dependent methyltransferase